MRQRSTRSVAGLAALAVGVLFAFLGLVVLGGQYGPPVLVAAVALLAAGTVLYGTGGGQSPEPPAG